MRKILALILLAIGAFNIASASPYSAVYEIFQRYEKNSDGFGKLADATDLDVEAAVETLHIFFTGKIPAKKAATASFEDRPEQDLKIRKATEAELEFGRMGMLAQILEHQCRVIMAMDAEGQLQDLLEYVYKNYKKSKNKAHISVVSEIFSSVFFSDSRRESFQKQLYGSDQEESEALQKRINLYQQINDIASTGAAQRYLNDTMAEKSYRQLKTFYAQLKDDDYDKSTKTTVILPLVDTTYRSPLEYNDQSVADLKEVIATKSAIKGRDMKVELRVESPIRPDSNVQARKAQVLKSMAEVDMAGLITNLRVEIQHLHASLPRHITGVMLKNGLKAKKITISNNDKLKVDSKDPNYEKNYSFKKLYRNLPRFKKLKKLRAWEPNNLIDYIDFGELETLEDVSVNTKGFQNKTPFRNWPKRVSSGGNLNQVTIKVSDAHDEKYTKNYFDYILASIPSGTFNLSMSNLATAIGWDIAKSAAFSYDNGEKATEIKYSGVGFYTVTTD